ncbi:hypothetical protein PFICI_04823 [Pestalotiopsis fici W106-1]|uniref:Methyltransferase domain-containing protein n=1 Tax=Pestalotiopsis fici (strain W106-1 / CGMCC3.15140) TaxID=1229662 RepID=W3XBY5_PESFW|nr:uncharacterized protein PFICI_04823 [Pestalotiopsis fici W106-1]ETS82947.1 hypothetical protein PFICI_04823 [Pestalotiopsis fici W106-1]
MNALQKTYNSFSSGMDDENLDKLLKSSDAIMGRPASMLLARAGIDASRTEPFYLLDNACATGTLGSRLQKIVDADVLEKSSVICGDIVEPSLDILKKRIEKDGWVNTKVAIIDAQHSKLPPGSFSHVTIHHGLHIIPQPDLVLEDTLRILQPGGVFALSTMSKDNAGWVPDIRSTFAALPFEAALPNPMPMTTNGHSEWADPGGVKRKLTEHGFQDIRVETIRHTQHIDSAEHFFDCFAMMMSWLVNTYWTPEQKAKYQGSLKRRMEDHLREKYDGKGWDLEWTMILATCRTR